MGPSGYDPVSKWRNLDELEFKEDRNLHWLLKGEMVSFVTEEAALWRGAL